MYNQLPEGMGKYGPWKVGTKVRHKHNGQKYTVGAYNPWEDCPPHKTWVKRSEDHHGYPVVTANLELDSDEKEEKENDMNTLYEITEGTHKGKFCEKLKRTSAGDWAVELKGKDADVIRVEEKHLEEVLPYTISVQFSNSAQEYSYLAEKGEFEEGFYMVKGYGDHTWQVARVTAVDTKSKKANKEFKPLGKLSVDMY